jgi:prepilin-type N-terminal cleavage/methylation domain-containing protein
MIKRKRKNRGFTLMETMIYIALFGIIMSGAVVGTYNLLEGGDRNVASAGVQEEGTFLIRKISWALSGGTAVSISGGGSNMTIARGGGASIVLNSDRFKISNVLFTYIASINGRPPSVSGSFLVGDKSFTFRDYLRQ